MSSIRSIVLGCVSEHGQQTPETSIMQTPKRVSKVKFGVPLASTLAAGQLPEALVDVIVYIACEGVATADLFRRPGSHTDLKLIVRRLAEGTPVQLSDYNFYTLASVIKMFLLKIPGGLFGAEIEHQLLNVLELNSHCDQCDAIHCIIASLPLATQRLVALLFGTWFRVVNHCEYNAMTSEALAKSVAGSIFHTCATEPTMVSNAVQLIRVIIDNFGQPAMLGHANIQYFTERTSTAIKVREKYKYRLSGRCPLVTADDTNDTLRVECVDECRQLFAHVITTDAACRGFDPVSNVITEHEFYDSRTSSEHDLREQQISSNGKNANVCETYHSLAYAAQNSMPNAHAKLTHMSSLSAPDVHQTCASASPTTQASPCVSTSFESGSLNRFDSVRRRQMVRLRKRSDWFLSSTLGDGVSPSVMQDSQTPSLGNYDTLPLEGHSSSLIVESSASPTLCAISSVPQVCINDSSVLDSEISPARQRHLDEGYSSRSAMLADNNASLFPTATENSLSSPSTSTAANSRPNVSSESSPSSAKHLLQSDTHYFLVDRFYGGNTVGKKTENGDAC